jgi:hypothetical protein
MPSSSVGKQRKTAFSGALAADFFACAGIFTAAAAGTHEFHGNRGRHAFREPGYVKIAWSLRADAIDDGHSTFHTETRVSTTDRQARDHFRRYWSFVAPGVQLIRIAMLRPLKCEAERRYQFETA